MTGEGGGSVKEQSVFHVQMSCLSGVRACFAPHLRFRRGRGGIWMRSDQRDLFRAEYMFRWHF